MTTNEKAGTAMIAGSLATLAIMAAHPGGHQVVATAESGGHNILNISVHFVAIVGLVTILTGTLALLPRLPERRDWVVTGVVLYAVGSLGLLIAAVASGFIATSTVHGLSRATPPEREAMLAALHYTGLINQAFARIGTIFSALAIGAWSYAMLGSSTIPRALAWYGLAAGPVLAVVATHLPLDVHGFGLLILGLVSWLIATGIVLRRAV